MKKEAFAYDNEELELLDEMKKGEWRDMPLSDQEKRHMRTMRLTPKHCMLNVK